MALTITPQISGQQADITLSYCFLYEPLKVHIDDSPSRATGQVGYTTGSVNISGLGTLFTTEISLGSIVTIDSLEYEIASIIDDSNATVTVAFTSSSLNTIMYIGSLLVNEIYADVTQISTSTGVAEATKVKYVVRDIAPTGGIVIDIMKVIKQLHDFDVYHLSDPSSLWFYGQDSVLSKYIYKFEFHTNESATKTTILKLPILGGRTFENFVPAVNHLTPIVELSNFDNAYLKNYIMPSYTLKDISLVFDNDYSLTKTSNTITQGEESCEGRIIWKSKLGGWMSWGMNLKTSKPKGSYQGSIDNGMFESTIFSGGGNAYVPVNYTSVSSSTSISLKCLSLTALELIAVSGIHGSPAVYYQKDTSSSMELMKLTSATTPIKTHIRGGDFSVSLSGLFNYEHRVK